MEPETHTAVVDSEEAELAGLRAELSRLTDDHALQRGIIAESDRLNQDFSALLEERERLKAYLELEDMKRALLATMGDEGAALLDSAELLPQQDSTPSRRAAWQDDEEEADADAVAAALAAVQDAGETPASLDSAMASMEADLDVLRSSRAMLLAHRDMLAKELTSMKDSAPGA